MLLFRSKRAVGEWGGTAFGKPVLATAILGRMPHHSPVVTIRSESDRRLEQSRSGRLQKLVSLQSDTDVQPTRERAGPS